MQKEPKSNRQKHNSPMGSKNLARCQAGRVRAPNSVRTRDLKPGSVQNAAFLEMKSKQQNGES